MLVMNKIVCLITVFLCFVQSILAYLVSEFNIDTLIESSDFIGVCKVLQVARDIPQPNKIACFKAECEVISTLKGEDEKILTVLTFLYPNVRPDNLGFGSLKKGDIAILFLKNGKQGSFDFAHKYHPKIPLLKFYSQNDVATNSIRDRISTQLVEGLKSETPNEVINSIRWLTEIDEDISQDKLLKFSKSKNKDLRVIALHRLLGYRNPIAIREVALSLLNPDIHKEISQSQLAELAWTLELEASCVSLDLANRLAASSNDIVQRIGVRILKEVGDTSSIPILMQALDAENKDTKRSAVVALTRITGKKVSGSSWHEFMKNPSAETQKWKTWWEEEGKKKLKNIDVISEPYELENTVTNNVKPNSEL